MTEKIEVNSAEDLYSIVKGFTNKKIYRSPVYRAKHSTNLYTLRKAKNDFLKKAEFEAKHQRMEENFKKNLPKY